jgi:hypothetical protein
MNSTCRCAPSRPRRRTGTRPAPCTARSCRRRWARGTGTSRSAGSDPDRPARARRTRSRPRTASSWPTTRLRSSLHAQQLLALAFQHLVDRNAGPARDHLGDLLGVTLLRSSCALLLAGSSLRGELLLELGMTPYCSSPCARGRRARCARSPVERALLELLLDLLRALHGLPSRLPDFVEVAYSLLELGRSSFSSAARRCFDAASFPSSAPRARS